MAQIHNGFESIEEEVKARKQREALAEAFSEDDGSETAAEETSSKTKITAAETSGVETLSLETKSRTEGYQATELFDIGGTIGVKLSRSEPASVDVLLADMEVKGNPFVDEFGAVRELSKKFDAVVWGKTEAMKDIATRDDWNDDYQIIEDKGGDRFLTLNDGGPLG